MLALLALVCAAGAIPRSPVQPARPARVPATLPATADAGVRKALVIQGDNHLFMVTAPTGWVLDDTAGMGSRIRCVFYPKGQKWSTAPTVMYVNPLHGTQSKERTASTLIAEDERAFLKGSPHGRITDAAGIATTGKKSAHVRYFSKDGGPPLEAVAYVPEKDLIMLLVLTSRTPQGFQEALAAYKSLVESYAWVGTNAEFGR